MNRTEAREYLIDQRFLLLQKFKQLSEVKEHFGMSDQDLFEALTFHAIMLYLDDNLGSLPEAFEMFDPKDMEDILYAVEAETQALARANRQDTRDADLSCSVETQQESQDSDAENDYSIFGDGFIPDSD